MSSVQTVVDGRSAGMRLDLFLTRYFALAKRKHGMSRASIQRSIVEGQVTLNGVKAKASSRLRVKDVVEIRSPPPKKILLPPEPLPLNVLYEDGDCIVINKAPGIAVHPAAGNSSGTLVNALLHRCADLQGIGGELRPGIVHRLDKDTSGVMIVAKNIFAFHQLADLFKQRRVNKEYLALVWGKLKAQQGMIDRPIGRHRSDRKKMSSLHALPRTREAMTEWSVEKLFRVQGEAKISSWVSWLRLKPRTGRTHQIRVHLAESGYPLVGDKIYGRKRRNGSSKAGGIPLLDAFPRQVLHAERLGITHPRTGAPMDFHAPLSEDIHRLLVTLEQRNMDRTVVSS